MASIKDSFIQASITEIMEIIKITTHDQPIMVWGQPGLGKTKSLYYNFRPEDGWTILPVLAGCSEPTDLTGVPFNYKDLYAKYLVPQWAFHCSKAPEVPEKHRGKTILFLDDIVTAPEQTQAAFFKLVHEKRVGEYELRDNVRIVAAGNRLDDKSAASPMPMALANRFLHIEAKVDSDTWIEWAVNSRIHPNIVAFIRSQPQHLTNFETAVKQTNEMAFATPRSWESVSKALTELDKLSMRSSQGTKTKEHDEKNPKNFTFKITAGLVGKGIASVFNQFIINTLGLITPDEILKDPMKARVPTEEQIDICYATVSAAEHYVMQHPKNWKPFAQYAVRIQPEFGLMLATKCTDAVINKLSDKEKIEAIDTKELRDVLEKYGDYLISK
jgi:MoxR-like ATPase